YDVPYGNRCGRESSALASSSPINRSAWESHRSLRPSFIAAWAIKQADPERCAISTWLMVCLPLRIHSSQFWCCSGLSYSLVSLSPITDCSILESLALNASFSLPSPAPGSVAVTPTLPRDTNIHPSVPSNRTPLGFFPLICITTSFG